MSGQGQLLLRMRHPVVMYEYTYQQMGIQATTLFSIWTVKRVAWICIFGCRLICLQLYVFSLREHYSNIFYKAVLSDVSRGSLQDCSVFLVSCKFDILLQINPFKLQSVDINSNKRTLCCTMKFATFVAVTFPTLVLKLSMDRSWIVGHIFHDEIRIRIRMMYGFEPFSVPMQLGPKTGPLCHAFYPRLKEPCCVTETPDGPHT